MAHRGHMLFHVIDSTAPAFEVTVDSTSVATALQSTGAREWAGAASRAIRVSSRTADDYSIVFGSTLAVAVAATAVLCLGGTVELFHPTGRSVRIWRRWAKWWL